MPIIKDSKYKAPFLFRNPHLTTIYPSLFRSNKKPEYQRERIETEDLDFLDLDWSFQGSETKNLAILCHGLEGSTENAYISNAIRILNLNSYDAVALSYRGCSGEANRLAKSYHSGKTEDLALTINHILEKYSYQNIYLIGFSVGGNLSLKYLGELSDQVDTRIKAAVTFSVPVSLESCALELAKKSNFIYMKNFLIKLEEKIKEKEKLFPGEISSEGFSKIKNFIDYDARYTAPLNGFKDERDYWNRASCLSKLNQIKIPSLIINALDDPFLGEECYPYEAAQKNPNLFLELPSNGGHLGFIDFNSENFYWHEQRMLEFLSNLIK